METLVFTSINEWDGLSKLTVCDPKHIIAVESRPDGSNYNAVLFLANGTQVKVKETAEEVIQTVQDRERS